LNNIWSTDVSAIDKHINQEIPWTKSGDQLQQVLQYEIDEIRTLAKKLKPFLPDTAEKIEEQFKGPKIKSSAPLFPRI
jgi:methionyl-tRNA synthetase